MIEKILTASAHMTIQNTSSEFGDELWLDERVNFGTVV
jgi:hypothetical protein